MVKTRIIPCLLLRNESLVKTVQFNKYDYIGDPVNTCRIFNELEVDELVFLDITASLEKREPNYRILQEIADECFMPLSYGGGIRSLVEAEHIFQIGFEKIILNTYPFENPDIITDLAASFGTQSIIIAIDVRKSILGNYHVASLSGTHNQKRHPVVWAREVQDRGAGEILLTAIDREGTWKGFDIELTAQVARAVTIPVITNGGAGTIQHIGDVVKKTQVSAVGLGSMIIYQKRNLGVLVNFPNKDELEKELE